MPCMKDAQEPHTWHKHKAAAQGWDNKIKYMMRKVGWVPQKGIAYAIPTEEHAEKRVNSFLDYDFSKVVFKVIGIINIFPLD